MARTRPAGNALDAVRFAYPSLLFTMLLAASAAAQDEPREEAAPSEPAYHVVVLSVGGDAPEGLAREARESVAAALARDGLRIVPEGELALRMPPSRLHGCGSIACAFSIGRELGVSMVAAVATWQRDGSADSVTVSLIVGDEEAHAATEALGERTLSEAAALAARGAQDARGRALRAETPALERPTAEAAPIATEDDRAVPIAPEPEGEGERSLEEYVLPGILGVVGLALAAGAVYALMPEECTLTGPSGACLRGNAPNVGLGTVFAITGGLSIAGSIVWLIVGGKPAPMGRIDVVMSPEGGGLEWRGTF